MKDSLTPLYRRLKIKERKRYDRETFMNVDGVKLGRPSTIKVNSIDNEYSVVTVLVFARGGHAIPIPYTVCSVLKTLYSIPIELIKDIEVLWSPQSKGDTISKQDLRREIPHMSTCYEKEKKIPHKWSLEEAGI